MEIIRIKGEKRPEKKLLEEQARRIARAKLTPPPALSYDDWLIIGDALTLLRNRHAMLGYDLGKIFGRSYGKLGKVLVARDDETHLVVKRVNDHLAHAAHVRDLEAAARKRKRK